MPSSTLRDMDGELGSRKLLEMLLKGRMISAGHGETSTSARNVPLATFPFAQEHDRSSDNVCHSRKYRINQTVTS